MNGGVPTEDAPPHSFLLPVCKLRRQRCTAVGQPACVTLRVWNRHHRRDVAAHRGLLRNISQTVETTRVDPASALLPQQGIPPVVQQLLYEVRIRAGDDERRRCESTSVLPNQIDIGERWCLRSREPLRLRT